MNAKRQLFSQSAATEEILNALKNREPHLSDEWLRQLHSSYMDRFLADNQRIWFTASVFVPLSLAAFPALFALKDPQLPHSIIFGCVSMSLISFWHFTAEKHRVFQSRSLCIVDAIETLAIGDTELQSIKESVRLHLADGRRPTVQKVRLSLWLGVVFGWLVIIFAFAASWL